MDNTDQVNTGDVLLFGAASLTGSVVRLVTSSNWNHVGIAIRINEKNEVSLNLGDKLFVFEINTVRRQELLTKDNSIGSGLTEYHWLKQWYNFIAVRRLDNNFRTERFLERTKQFIKDHHGDQFPNSTIANIGLALGIPLAAVKGKKQSFCSELTTKFYLYTLSLHPDGDREVGMTEKKGDQSLTLLFGKGRPKDSFLFTPETYSVRSTPNSTIFDGAEQLVYKNYSGAVNILAQPLIITAFLLVLILILLG